MANNQLLASDNFADGSIAAGWALAQGLTRTCEVVAGSPNVTEPQTTSEYDGQVWTGLSWPLDQISELTIGAFTEESATLIVLLVTGLTIAAGDIWSFHAEGAALSVYQNFNDTDPFLGTVVVVESAPAGAANSYLGQVRSGSPGAAQSNPTLGQVVVVDSAPSGDSDPYLGQVEGL